MDKAKLVYCCFILVSFILAAFCKKQEKGLFIFPVLLSFSLMVEIITIILEFYKLKYFYIYHIFIPVEYTLWISYFYFITDNAIIRKIILITIPVFSIFCLYITISIVSLKDFPTIQLNIEGILLIIIAIYTIFTIEIKKNVSLFSRPVFWICVGVIVYYSSISSYMGFYNFIVKNKIHLLNLKFYFLIIPNYILYTCLSIAFICSNRIKK